MPGADQQDEGERDLGHHQAGAQPTLAAARREPPPVLVQDPTDVEAGRLQRRHEAEDDAGYSREAQATGSRSGSAVPDRVMLAGWTAAIAENAPARSSHAT